MLLWQCIRLPHVQKFQILYLISPISWDIKYGGEPEPTATWYRADQLIQPEDRWDTELLIMNFQTKFKFCLYDYDFLCIKHIFSWLSSEDIDKSRLGYVFRTSSFFTFTWILIRVAIFRSGRNIWLTQIRILNTFWNLKGHSRLSCWATE